MADVTTCEIAAAVGFIFGGQEGVTKTDLVSQARVGIMSLTIRFLFFSTAPK